jgi:hypothetical protein
MLRIAITHQKALRKFDNTSVADFKLLIGKQRHSNTNVIEDSVGQVKT